MVESFTNAIRAKGLSLKLDAPVPIEVVGDRDKLIQLMYILTDNAIKYTPAGGYVEIKLKKQNHKKHDDFLFSVSDTGIGISPEDQKKIFERFYRADKTRSRKEGGYGLGLSIAQSIAETHGGAIKVESTPDRGSVFSVAIPFEAETAQLGKAAEASVKQTVI